MCALSWAYVLHIFRHIYFTLFSYVELLANLGETLGRNLCNNRQGHRRRETRQAGKGDGKGKGEDKVPGSHRASMTSTIIPMGVPAWSRNTRQYSCRPGSQTSTRAASIKGTAMTTLPKTRHGTVIPARIATTSAEGVLTLIFMGY